ASTEPNDATKEPGFNLPPGYYEAIRDADLYQLPAYANDDASACPPPIPCQPRYPPPPQSATLPQGSSVKGSNSSIDRPMQRFEQLLTAVDFFPACVAPGNLQAQRCPQFMPFNTVVSAANNWLASNRGISALVRCECIERMANMQGELQPEAALQHEPGRLIRAFVVGLRLWCRQEPRASLKEIEPTQIWYINAMPRIEQRTIAAQVRPGFGFDESAGGMDNYGMSACVPTFTKEFSVPFVEPLSEFLPRINEWLSASPPPGRICGVQTMLLRCAVDQRKFDLDATVQWHLAEVSRMRLFYYRLFYIVGDPLPRQEIGIKVFVPDVHPDYKPRQMHSNLHRHSMIIPAPNRYEDYQTVLTNALSFASTLTGARVTDVQSFNITTCDFLMSPVQIALRSQREADDQQQLGPSNMNKLLQLDGNMSYEFLPAGVPFREHTCIRVAYVKSPLTAGLQTGLPTNSGLVTSKLFVPDRISVKSFEPLNRFMQRLLDGAAKANCRVLTAETFNMYVDPTAASINTELTYRPELAYNGRYRLTVVRMLFDGPSFDLPPSFSYIPQKQPPAGGAAQPSNSCCSCQLL
ncbi:hypothetical protein BOX15_Mlig026042g1, partial [Macrostomum lignano]